MKPESLRMAAKYQRRPLPENFVLQLERWDNFIKDRHDGVFFRPLPGYEVASKIPVYAEDGVSPELAMFIMETHGDYAPTTDPERFADYLQGKAIEGLMRKQWKEDMLTGAFWAEELVIDGLMGFKEAERLFTRKLNGHLLWLFDEEKRLCLPPA